MGAAMLDVGPNRVNPQLAACSREAPFSPEGEQKANRHTRKLTLPLTPLQINYFHFPNGCKIVFSYFSRTPKIIPFSFASESLLGRPAPSVPKLVCAALAAYHSYASKTRGE